MSAPTPTAGPGARTERPLGGRVASGTAWMLGQSVAIKIISLVAQIILARLLLQEDFGLFGICLAFSGVASLIRSGGVLQVLVQRGRRFHLWAGPAFWMTLSLSLVGSAFLLISGPIAASIYGEPKLALMLALLALEPPLTALATLPRARLMHELQFRTLTAIQLPAELLRQVAMIGFALLGLGALSFVLSRIVYAVLSTGAMLALRFPRERLRPRLRAWSRLTGDSGYAFGAEAIYLVIAQGGYLILGIFASTAVVGVFFFAFNISLQAVGLLTTNLQQVLFPTLSRLSHEPARQWEACLRGSRAMALVAGGVCAVQVAGAPAGVPLVFGDRWLEAVLILQLLAPALLLRMVWPLTTVLLQSRRDFRGVFLIRCVTGPVFVLVVGVGAARWGAPGAAIGCAIHALLELALLSRRAAGSWAGAGRMLLDVLGGPTTAGLLAAAAGLGVDALLRQGASTPRGLLLPAAGSVAAAGLLYAVAALLLCHPAVVDLARTASRSPRLARLIPARIMPPPPTR